MQTTAEGDKRGVWICLHVWWIPYGCCRIGVRWLRIPGIAEGLEGAQAQSLRTSHPRVKTAFCISKVSIRVFSSARFAQLMFWLHFGGYLDCFRFGRHCLRCQTKYRVPAGSDDQLRHKKKHGYERRFSKN
eukprot:3626040-Amphidinium_carterae.1